MAAPSVAAAQGAAPPPLDLVVRTLGGSALRPEGLTEGASLAELRAALARELGAAPFTLELLSGAQRLQGEGQTLADLGVASPGAALVVVRRPGEREDYVELFGRLTAAIRSGRGDLARDLVDQGAGLDAEGALLRVRPGREAGSWGAASLLENVADEEQAGCTMLHLAVREGLVDLALFLLRRGGLDADARNEGSRTALAQAAIRGHAPVVDALLAMRADPRVRDDTGRSALFYAVRRGDDAVAARLLAASSYAEEESTFGLLGCSAQPLLFCIERGLPATAVALLEAGMPLSAMDVAAGTAVCRAKVCRMDRVVDALLARGCQRPVVASGCCAM